MNTNLSPAMSNGVMTAVTAIVVAIVTYIASRGGARDVRRSSIEAMFMTRLGEVEKSWAVERELLDKERTECADATNKLREEALSDQKRIQELELHVNRLEESIRVGLADFLKCQKNVVYLAGRLNSAGIVIDLANMSIPSQQGDGDNGDTP